MKKDNLIPIKWSLLILSSFVILFSFVLFAPHSRAQADPDPAGDVTTEAPSTSDSQQAPPSSSSTSSSSIKLVQPKDFHKEKFIKECIDPARRAAKECSDIEVQTETAVGKQLIENNNTNNPVAIADGASTQESNTRVAQILKKKEKEACLTRREVCKNFCTRTENYFKDLIKNINPENGTYTPKQIDELNQATFNESAARQNVKNCEIFFNPRISRMQAEIDNYSSSAEAATTVKKAAEADTSNGDRSRYTQLGGTDSKGGPPGGGDTSGGSSWSPWLIGGIAAGVGGLTGYLVGKGSGEKEGYKKGQSDATKASSSTSSSSSGFDTDTNGDGVMDTNCSSTDSTSNTKCRDSLSSRCDKTPTDSLCNSFANSYCTATDISPNAVLCRKISAATYCSSSDSINKNNCPSCRELSNGFTGQYSPEDLSNSCAVCTNDPYCTSSNSFVSYQTNRTTNYNFYNPNSTVNNSSLSFQTNTSSSTPSSSTSIGGQQTTDSSNPFGTEEGSIATTFTVRHSNVNTMGIASAHSNNNFKAHTATIQSLCQQGKLVGCGPLRGLATEPLSK